MISSTLRKHKEEISSPKFSINLQQFLSLYSRTSMSRKILRVINGELRETQEKEKDRIAYKNLGIRTNPHYLSPTLQNTGTEGQGHLSRILSRNEAKKATLWKKGSSKQHLGKMNSIISEDLLREDEEDASRQKKSKTHRIGGSKPTRKTSTLFQTLKMKSILSGDSHYNMSSTSLLLGRITKNMNNISKYKTELNNKEIILNEKLLFYSKKIIYNELLSDLKIFGEMINIVDFIDYKDKLKHSKKINLLIDRLKIKYSEAGYALFENIIQELETNIENIGRIKEKNITELINLAYDKQYRQETEGNELPNENIIYQYVTNQCNYLNMLEINS